MAIEFKEPEYVHNQNGTTTIKLVDNNNENNIDYYSCTTHRLEQGLIRRKALLTHRWEGTRPAEWYPVITFIESESGLKMGFKSTVNCRVLDSEGNIDTVEQDKIIATEKSRYLTDIGFTES